MSGRVSRVDGVVKIKNNRGNLLACSSRLREFYPTEEWPSGARVVLCVSDEPVRGAIGSPYDREMLRPPYLALRRARIDPYAERLWWWVEDAP